MYDSGYFDDERDGFGPVCETLEETVDAIVSLVASGCQMPQKYRKRADDFYGEQPECRCKAVVDALNQLVVM